jgi:outer membrane protein TolC
VGPVELLGRERDALPYRRLRAFDARCLAAKAARVANALEGEGQLQRAREARKGHGAHASCVAELQQTIFTCAALEDRNRAAGEALESYYRLGEAEVNWTLLQQTLPLIDDALRRARDLKAHGLLTTVDDAALHRRQLDAQADGIKLKLAIQGYNADLRGRLGFAPGPWLFWPADAFAVCLEPVDPDWAVTLALEKRPELVLLRVLEANLTPASLPAVRALLQSVNGLLGRTGPKSCFPGLQECLMRLGCDQPGAEEEVEARRQQLYRYRSQREREVAEETAQAARSVQAQLEAVAVAVQRVGSWKETVEREQDRETRGIGSFAETTDARVEQIRARRQLFKEILGLQRARVDLQQAQGVLPLGCMPPDCAQEAGQPN